jgi:alginate O-acetyltransferase complex protein AlgJ
MERARTIPLIICFLAFLAFPFMNDYLGMISDVKSYENRSLAKEPAFDINRLDPFPARYDTFYNDHFNLRSALIQLHSAFKIRAFGISPVPDKVIIGDDDWLFANTDEFRSFLGVDRLSDEELRALTEELEYRREYLEKRGCTLYLAITPAKASVYPEKLGIEHHRHNTETWGEQLNAHLQKHAALKVIDLFAVLKSKKSEGELYYRLDNHWNELGAFFAAQEIIRIMKKDLPELEALDIKGFYMRDSVSTRGNMANMFGGFVKFSEAELRLTPKKGYRWQYGPPGDYPCVPGFAYCWDYQKVAQIADTTKPRLLVVSDSYGQWIFPYLADHFSRTVKIFDAWQFKLNEPIVEAEKPDALVILMNEALIRKMLDFRSGPKKVNW